jgi:hypothetical protein
MILNPEHGIADGAGWSRLPDDGQTRNHLKMFHLRGLLSPGAGKAAKDFRTAGRS